MAKFSFLKVWVLACCCMSASLAMAQQQDTARHQLRVVEVFGKPAEVYAAGSRVTHLDSAYLSTYASSTLAEALQAHTPVYFKSYGVSGISSITFRGTNASQTAVLWNGLPISSPALGQTDFSVLPLSGFGEVSMQCGSAAATYGSGAIGGAVLLSSPTYNSKGFGGDMQLEAGSFGRVFSNGSIHYNNNKLQLSASAYTRYAENDFLYKDFSRSGAPEVSQQHAAVTQHGFTQGMASKLNSRTDVALHTWYTFSDRELQPAMGSASNQAYQQDKNLRIMSELNHDSRWGQTSIKAAFFHDYLLFTEHSAASETDVYTSQLQAEQTYAYAERWSLRGGINLQRFTAENDGYAGKQSENRASAFVLFRYDPVQTLKLSMNLRQAFVSGYNPHPTPALGFDWKFYNSNHNQLSLKGNVSGSYRVPTLNDRYWAGAGNPNMKPEQGWNYESGLRHVFVKGSSWLWETEATAFYMLIDDWIQWTPESSGRWRPVNLQKVISKGVELSTKATSNIGQVKLSSSAGYTYTSSVQAEVYEGSGDKGKQLMYVPRHKAILTTDAAYKGWSVLGSLNYTGLRYTSNSETSYLDNFLLLHLAINKKLALGHNSFICTLRADNVTSTEYQTMAYRAMPPRGYTFSLRFIIP